MATTTALLQTTALDVFVLDFLVVVLDTLAAAALEVDPVQDTLAAAALAVDTVQDILAVAALVA